MNGQLGCTHRAPAIGGLQRPVSPLRRSSRNDRRAMRATQRRKSDAVPSLFLTAVARGAARDPLDSSSSSSSGSSGGVGGVAALVGTPLYTALQWGELLVILGLIDAGYSGDWSRIGAISKEAELVLQKVSLFIIVAHLGVGAAAGVIAARKGKSPLVPALKGFLFGALGLYEEQHSP